MRWDFLKSQLHSIAMSLQIIELSESKKRKLDLEEQINEYKNKTTPLTEEEENELAQITGEFYEIEEKETDALFKKSKARWRELGEKSNKYFFRLITKHSQMSTIRFLIDSSNTIRSSLVHLKDITYQFYSNLYKNNPRQTTPQEDESFFQHCPKLSSDQKQFLDAPITLTELQNALSSCDDSSPGLDGIPYSYYKAFGDILLPELLASWSESCQNGRLTPSQRLSSISLIPKKDKNLVNVENWRPISLTNCDVKIITKALALRLNHVLPSIIHKSQAAYVPGRSITDNTRLLHIADAVAKKEHLNWCIVGLDARKAFDSVDHLYISKVLRYYGFGNYFIQMFEIIYTDQSASVMVNGNSGLQFNLERGVKQGDALSCGLFILSIDPLLRNIEANSNILPIQFRHRHSVNVPSYKLAAYADDVAILTLNQQPSIQAVFDEYNRLADQCGLVLNAKKTEFYLPNRDVADPIRFTYNNQTFRVPFVEKIVICGIQFGHDEDLAYDYNIQRRITKMERNYVLWSTRNLTLNGRIMIAKTFGISQIIYAAATVAISHRDIRTIERLFYKFVWTKGWDKKSIDRIKRSFLKQTKDKGGLNSIDAQALDMSIKVKNFFRIINDPNNYIHELQIFLVTEEGNPEDYFHEFRYISTLDAFTAAAQTALNKSTKYYYDKFLLNPPLYKEMRDFLLSSNLTVFADSHRYLMLHFWLTRMRGPSTLAQLFDSRINLRPDSYFVCNLLPNFFKSLQQDYILQQPIIVHKYFFQCGEVFCSDQHISTRLLQLHFKSVLNSVAHIDITTRLDLLLEDQDKEKIFTLLYNKILDPSFRALRYRILHKDVFTKVKMFKLGMCPSALCDCCQVEETISHQLYDCQGAKHLWRWYNATVQQFNRHDLQVFNFQEAILIPPQAHFVTELFKSTILKFCIQIDRPTVQSHIAVYKFLTNYLARELYILKKKPDKNMAKMRAIENFKKSIDFTYRTLND
jgi:hypothetical protein